MTKLSEEEKRARRDPGIRIFDEVSAQFVDVLKLVLLVQFGHTHVPEIYSIFGKEAFLKFLDIFSGISIEVPRRKDLLDAFRDTRIYLALDSLKDDETRAVLIKDLAGQYEMRPGEIRQIYYDLKGKLDRFKGVV